MKLSEMSTDMAADALVRIADPASEIINDENVFIVFRNAAKLKDAAPNAQIAFVVRDVAPLLLKTHRKAVYAVLSIMTGKTEKQIGEQVITETIKDIRESVDGELLSFFTPSKEQMTGSET